MEGIVRRVRALAAALIIGVAAPGALGNGWEHHAIPLPALLGALDGADAELRAQAVQALGAAGPQRSGQPPFFAAIWRPTPPPRQEGGTATASSSRPALGVVLVCLRFVHRGPVE